MIRSSIPSPAQYLLRFDDFCPTMDWGKWQRFERLIHEFGIRPILAVVPENRDPALNCGAVDPKFWTKVRALEARGSTIALHGLHHTCNARGRSLIPLHRATEFAGVSFEVQREWIAEGLRTLTGFGLTPRLFIAPRHGFDRNTLRVLKDCGIEVLSDGFARVPFRRYEMLWIPQQLWRPVEKSHGVWTICIHSNTASDKYVDELNRFCERHAAQFTTLDQVVAEFGDAQLSAAERVFEAAAMFRLRASSVRRRLMGPS